MEELGDKMLFRHLHPQPPWDRSNPDPQPQHPVPRQKKPRPSMKRSQPENQSPMPPSSEPGHSHNQASRATAGPHTTQRQPISHTQPKMAGPPKCKHSASIETCTPPQTKELKPPAPASPSSRRPEAPPRPPPCPRERCQSSKLKGATERPQPVPHRGCPPPPRCRTANNQASQAKLIEPSRSCPRAKATETSHILPYVRRDMVKNHHPQAHTTHHGPPGQTPPQYKAEKPEATAKPSIPCPAVPTQDGQSHTA
ncbi:hypothetical protein CRENBAI_010494 [Crenichthys baileyi]|uniref:Uncharacterized protein n=1 Tax=Crenichthys baileyi TaxID=28760 RepID=A0AAV9S128_9TELE